MKCFIDAGFPVVDPNDVSTQDDDLEDDLPLTELRKRIAVGDFDDVTEIENECPIEESYDGHWEEKLLSEFKTVNSENSEKESDSDEDTETDIPSESSTTHTHTRLFCVSFSRRESLRSKRMTNIFYRLNI